MRDLLWLTPTEALAVAISTAAMYLALVVLVRLLGHRMVSSMSAFDWAAVIAFGSIIGRAALGEAPVLGGGLVALLTLVAVQAATGALRVLPLGNEMVSRHPVLLMADGRVFLEQLRKVHITSPELHSQLRLAGVHGYDEVAMAVFEPTGRVSVLHQGVPIEPRLLIGVDGRALVPEHLLAQGGA
ncbi:DUF421 domain-containing protein [Nocardioides panacisoli]|uniref:DUF421 domain-containing protein n=1 Tax=Nocardioides panacisoli TaxID=627624 RepID=UPI001C6331AC|nr:YetF domain-containing protein [Nocardioides panacisoli]QYJ03394.1 DUF421 domain-containing protein [Nocardioides panacisoli]